jgi:hypothetical protein
MSRAPLIALVALAAACPKTPPHPCSDALMPSTTLFMSYCPAAPQGICFVDQMTNL